MQTPPAPHDTTGPQDPQARSGVAAGSVPDIAQEFDFSRGDRRFLKKIELTRAFGKAVRNDLVVHPWKLFFLAAPIAPPLSGTVTVILTAIHIALGLTRHARTQRAIVTDAIKKPLDTAPFVAFVNPQDDTPKLDRGTLFKHVYYQTMAEMYGMGVHYGTGVRRRLGVSIGIGYMERQQVRMQDGMVRTRNKYAPKAA